MSKVIKSFQKLIMSLLKRAKRLVLSLLSGKPRNGEIKKDWLGEGDLLVKGRKVKKGKKCPNCGTRMECVSDTFSYCPHCKIKRRNTPEFIKKIKYEKKERRKLEKQVKVWTSKNTSQEELKKLIPSFQDSTGDGV